MVAQKELSNLELNPIDIKKKIFVAIDCHLVFTPNITNGIVFSLFFNDLKMT